MIEVGWEGPDVSSGLVSGDEAIQPDWSVTGAPDRLTVFEG